MQNTNVNEVVKVFRVFAKERTTTDGKKYIVLSYTKDGEKFFQVKLNKTCTRTINFPGYYKVSVKKSDMSIQHGKKKTINGTTFIENDTIWIKELQDVTRDREYEDLLDAAREKELDAAFD